jgi:cytochrome b561
MSEKSLRYTNTMVWLHWITALLMIFMLFWGEELMEVRRGQSLANWQPSAHASIGALILLLAIARLLWRAGHPPPPLPQTTTRFEEIASRLTHGAFYGLMIAIPVLGLMALAPFWPGTRRCGSGHILQVAPACLHAQFRRVDG